jgi:hypothetical protein
MFSYGRTVAEDQQHSRQPSKTRRGESRALVRELVQSNRDKVKIIADEMNMGWETIHLILTVELGMRKLCAKMVPRNLTEQQQDVRLSAVFDIQMHNEATASLLT